MSEKENCALLTRVFVNIATSILYNTEAGVSNNWRLNMNEF